MLSLKLKLEKALAAHLKSATAGNAALRGVRIHEGHTIEARSLPCVIIHGDADRPNPDVPGASDVSVRVFVLTQADDEDLTAHDARLAAVVKALENAKDIRAALNAAAENRSVCGLHVYDVTIETVDEGRDERHHGDVITARITASNFDEPLDLLGEPEGDEGEEGIPEPDAEE